MPILVYELRRQKQKYKCLGPSNHMSLSNLQFRLVPLGGVLTVLGLLHLVGCADGSKVQLHTPVSSSSPSEGQSEVEKLEIANGTDGSSWGAVGAITSSFGSLTGCSSFVAKGRCIVSAKHCGSMNYFTNASVVTAAGVKVPIIRTTALGDGTGQQLKGPIDDLEVIWAADKKCSKEGSCTANGWSTMPVAYLYPGAIRLTAVGYGHNAGLAGSASGAGVKRQGTVMNEFNTAFYKTIRVKPDPIATPGQLPCQGDSGGPIIQNGTAYGVASTRDPAGDCQITPNSRGVYASFAGNTSFDGTSKSAWLDKAMSDFCAPRIGVKISKSPVAGGTVTAKKDLYWVTCGSECSIPADIHPHRSIVLSVAPAPGYSFLRWEGATKTGSAAVQECICAANPTSAACTLKPGDNLIYEVVGGEPKASEEARCKAVFRSITAPTPTMTPFGGTPTPTRTATPIGSPTATPTRTPTSGVCPPIKVDPLATSNSIPLNCRPSGFQLKAYGCGYNLPSVTVQHPPFSNGQSPGWGISWGQPPTPSNPTQSSTFIRGQGNLTSLELNFNVMPCRMTLEIY